jgi:hypothetical protein
MGIDPEEELYGFNWQKIAERISGGWDRTTDTRLMKPSKKSPQHLAGAQLSTLHSKRRDRALPEDHDLNANLDPLLAELMEALPALPDHIKRTIQTLIAPFRGRTQ